MILLFLILLLLGPRFATIVWWLMEPTRFNLTFSTYLFPILGILFVPCTTLMYVLVFPGGLTGFDWMWLGLALLIDISAAGGGAYKGKQQMAAPAPTPPPKPSETKEN